MKSLSTFLLLVSCLVFFSGCGSDNTTTNTVEGVTQDEIAEYEAMIKASEEADNASMEGN